jgi:hypothetical protein
MLIGGIAVASAELPRQPFWRVETAAWLAEALPAGSPIMTRNTETALYAGHPMVAFPRAEWPQIVEYAKARGARYLVVDDKEIREVRPYLAPLLEDNGAPLPEGLAPVSRLERDGRTVLIYEFKNH